MNGGMFSDSISCKTMSTCRQMSIGRQWKELVDYNEMIGFIVHVSVLVCSLMWRVIFCCASCVLHILFCLISGGSKAVREKCQESLLSVMIWNPYICQTMNHLVKTAWLQEFDVKEYILCNFCLWCVACLSDNNRRIISCLKLVHLAFANKLSLFFVFCLFR